MEESRRISGTWKWVMRTFIPLVATLFGSLVLGVSLFIVLLLFGQKTVALAFSLSVSFCVLIAPVLLSVGVVSAVSMTMRFRLIRTFLVSMALGAVFGFFMYPYYLLYYRNHISFDTLLHGISWRTASAALLGGVLGLMVHYGESNKAFIAMFSQKDEKKDEGKDQSEG